MSRGYVNRSVKLPVDLDERIRELGLNFSGTTVMLWRQYLDSDLNKNQFKKEFLEIGGLRFL